MCVQTLDIFFLYKSINKYTLYNTVFTVGGYIVVKVSDVAGEELTFFTITQV